MNNYVPAKKISFRHFCPVITDSFIHIANSHTPPNSIPGSMGRIFALFLLRPPEQ